MIGYQPSLLSQKLIVATTGSTNHRASTILVNDEIEARPLKLADIVAASEARRQDSKKDKLIKQKPPKPLPPVDGIAKYNSMPNDKSNGQVVRLPTLNQEGGRIAGIEKLESLGAIIKSDSSGDDEQKLDVPKIQVDKLDDSNS